jgi:hypothetical protein
MKRLFSRKIVTCIVVVALACVCTGCAWIVGVSGDPQVDNDSVDAGPDARPLDADTSK